MKEINVLSHGAGVQTSCMVAMCLEGDLPKPDLIVFADPKWELKATYEYLKDLKKKIEQAGIPFVIESKGDIYKDTMESALTGKRAPSMPFYTKEGKDNGMVQRQCTNDYKIEVVKKAVRNYLGLKPRQRLTNKVIMWKGITLDEIERVRVSGERMIEFKYPLIEKNMDRQDCINWLRENGYGVPPKSSCVGCPFHSRQTWVDIYLNYPDEFQKAVELDKAIRNHKLFRSELYLHVDRIPLEEAVKRDANQVDLFYDYDGFRNDCQGYCGV